MKLRLEEDKLHLRDLQSVWRLDLEEWEPYDENYPSRELLSEVEESGEIVFGPFNCFASEYDH